jgi:hypothetical protein
VLAKSGDTPIDFTVRTLALELEQVRAELHVRCAGFAILNDERDVVREPPDVVRVEGVGPAVQRDAALSRKRAVVVDTNAGPTECIGQVATHCGCGEARCQDRGRQEWSSCFQRAGPRQAILQRG